MNKQIVRVIDNFEDAERARRIEHHALGRVRRPAIGGMGFSEVAHVEKGQYHGGQPHQRSQRCSKVVGNGRQQHIAQTFALDLDGTVAGHFNVVNAFERAADQRRASVDQPPLTVAPAWRLRALQHHGTANRHGALQGDDERSVVAQFDGQAEADQ